MRSAHLLSHEERFEHELTWLALKNTIRGPTLSEKDRHLCMRLERLWRNTNLVPRASFPLTSGRKTRALGATIMKEQRK